MKRAWLKYPQSTATRVQSVRFPFFREDQGALKPEDAAAALGPTPTAVLNRSIKRFGLRQILSVTAVMFTFIVRAGFKRQMHMPFHVRGNRLRAVQVL